MGAKLSTPSERVTWRIDADDMELLRLLFPGKVNEVARRAMRHYCESLRAKGFGQRTPVEPSANVPPR